jgi:hypothetical protein
LDAPIGKIVRRSTKLEVMKRISTLMFDEKGIQRVIFLTSKIKEKEKEKLRFFREKKKREKC